MSERGGAAGGGFAPTEKIGFDGTPETPTEIHWSIEVGYGDIDTYLVGYERPIDPDHMQRRAGKLLWDDGAWRELERVVVALPTDVKNAKAMRLALELTRDEPALD